jgi:Lsr2
MVERRVVELVDDLDGSHADETVRFAIDGRDYEIDLSSQNARKLRTSLRPYLSAGRRTGTRHAQPATSGAHEETGRSDDSRQIRQWARGRGLDVSSRGRIPAYLRQAYERR